MYDQWTVCPSRPVPKQIIKLSLCDVYSPKVWVTQTHFWSLEDGKDFDRAYSVLKQGLSRTLAEVPGFAGTVRRTSEDPRDVVVSIDDMAHVDFPAEDLSNNANVPSYERLRAAGFPMTGLADPFSAPITLSPVSEGAPMLAVKFNKLRHGAALSFGFNHLLADASTVAEVERIWAAHTADVAAGVGNRSHKDSTDDEITRTRLSTPLRSASTEYQNAHFSLFPMQQSQLFLPEGKVIREAAYNLMHETKEKHRRTMASDIATPKWCIWRFTPASLVQLKKDCSTGLSSGEWVSTMDAIIGLFWSRVLWLKSSSRGEQSETVLCFPINIRSRLDPPLHAQYIGNAVDVVAANASLVEIEDLQSGWVAGARAVRKAVESWKQESWESWLATAAALSHDKAICPNPLMLLDPRNIAFNDYSKSQSNTLDWGAELGRPERTRYMKPAGSMKGFATAVVVHPRLPDGGLEVATTSTDDIRDALEQDNVFRRYAELTCSFD